MKILALDTSSLAASAALWEDGQLLGENYTNVHLTHSRTIMPMVEQLFANTGCRLEEVDLFGVSTGPGSFTGLRIGLAAVKGMAFSIQKPCAGVSTLEALAQNLSLADGLVCPVMDARCKQVYTALFACTPGQGLTRLVEDSAMSLEDLEKILQTQNRPVFLVGDGAQLCYNEFNGRVNHLLVAPAPLLHQRAASVAQVAGRLARENKLLTPGELVPSYLRLPQAQRELLARKSKERKAED